MLGQLYPVYVLLHIFHVYFLYFFFFNDTATTEIYTLSLHDALPICQFGLEGIELHRLAAGQDSDGVHSEDRKSTRLNSSHSSISYAVFCLKKKKKIKQINYKYNILQLQTATSY